VQVEAAAEGLTQDQIDDRVMEAARG